MKITIIGAGNMGGSIALGLAASGALPASHITVTARHEQTLEKFRPVGIVTSTHNGTAVKEADIVFYAVKPYQMEDVVKETAPELDYDRQTVVSVAPGVTVEQFRHWLGRDGRMPAFAYVIPNTALEVGQSMTYICPVTTDDGQTGQLKALFDQVGRTAVVPVEDLLAGTSLASCGIAYAMRYIGAAAEGGSRLGLDRARAGEAVCQTVRGAVALFDTKGFDPEREIGRVTTPNGLTARGLDAMEEAGFSEAVVKGLMAVRKPSARRRMVVKVGSNVLTRADGSLDTTRVSAIVDQIVELRELGYETVLVTSGAVACGRAVVRPDDGKFDEVQRRQLYSAIGQVRLMDLYYRLFQNYGITVGQVLTQKKNFDEGQEYDNQKACIDVMLQNHVIPIVNENDTVSITELMFTDNDELSGLVAGMVGAEDLVLLTNVDGLFDGSPDDPGASVIPRVKPGEAFGDHISRKKSSSGRGGMLSKCTVASRLASEGVRVIIANGRREHILVDVLTDPDHTVHTVFEPYGRS